MPFHDFDRNLLKRCLAREAQSWDSFVDRFLGLVVHVVNHSARAKSIPISPEDREDLCAEVFLTILKDDFAVLRAFRGACSLATYLTVVARRVVVRELLKKYSSRKPIKPLQDVADQRDGETRESDREQVDHMLHGLDDREAQIVRMYHLEGRSYSEISDRTGMPENSVGPTLSRARNKLRDAVE